MNRRSFFDTLIKGVAFAVSNNWRQLGYLGVRLQPNWEINEDRFGLVSATLTWEGQVNDLFNLTPKPGSRHPFATHLVCETRTIRGNGVWGLATVKYCGMQPEKGDESDAVYSLRMGVSSEPIETHPNFKTQIGGTPANPMNGAIFIDAEGNVTDDNATGFFDRFKLYVNGEQNPFAGISSYLDSGEIIWTKRYTKRSEPNMNNLFKIDTPPGNPPSLGEGRNWIKLPPSFERRAHVYSVEESWRGSGRGGANETIYA